MAVEYITIKGEKQPVQFGYEAYKMLQKKHGINIDDVNSVNWENYEPALFYALKMGAEADGIEFTWKMPDMVKVLNECLWEFVALIPKFFPDVEEVDKELAKTPAASGKKPPTGQTRKRKA
jgi:hypothetical protein